MYQLRLTQLPVLLTLYFSFSTAVAGVNPSPTREETKEALRTIGKFLKDEAGSSWLAGIATGRTQPFNTEQLMRELINSTASNDSVKRAAGIVVTILEEQRMTGKKDEPLILEPEGWKELVEKVEEQDDIICIYRKISNTSQRSNDWEKLLTSVTFDYVIQLALEMGQKYVLCLKKIDKNETTTARSAEQIEMTEEVTEPTTTTAIPDLETRDTSLEAEDLTMLKEDALEEETHSRKSESDFPREETKADAEIIERQNPINNADLCKCLGKSIQSISLQCRDLYVRRNDDGNGIKVPPSPTEQNPPPPTPQWKQWPPWDQGTKRSMNSEPIELPFNHACEQLKFSHKSQSRSVDMPSDANINNNSPGNSLNLRPQSSLYQPNGNGFMNNLVSIYDYPRNHNFYPLAYRQSDPQQFYPFFNAQFSGNNAFRSQQISNYGHPAIFQDTVGKIMVEKNIHAEKDAINDALNVVILLNNNPKELTTISIRTETDKDIPVYRKKKLSKKNAAKKVNKSIAKMKSKKKLSKNNKELSSIFDLGN